MDFQTAIATVRAQCPAASNSAQNILAKMLANPVGGGSLDAIRTSYSAEWTTVFVPCNVVDVYPSGATRKIAHVVPIVGEYSGFSYGRDGDITLVYGNTKATRKATRTDTSILDPNSLGPTSKSIESVSASAMAPYIAYDLTSANVLNGQAAPVNPSVLAAYQGLAPFYDSTGIVEPQEFSPRYALEDILMQALAPHLFVQLKFDRTNQIEFGLLDQIPEGAGHSFKRANGSPNVDNRFVLPQGLEWDADSMANSRLQFKLCVDVCPAIPITLPISLWGLAAPETAGRPIPLGLNLPIRVRLHGPEFTYQSDNA